MATHDRLDVYPMWAFWLPDEDRSAGWTNHCYTLQFVCRARGQTPEKAWKDALTLDQVPEGFHLPDVLIAIREDRELRVEVTNKGATRVATRQPRPGRSG